MRTKIFITLITLISLTSCQDGIKAKFEITNQTKYRIDSIIIKSFDHSETKNYLTLEPGETKIYLLDMTNISKVDGDYLLKYKNEKTGVYRERFGYFTNGYPLEDVTIIKIKKDSVIIDQVFSEY